MWWVCNLELKSIHISVNFDLNESIDLSDFSLTFGGDSQCVPETVETNIKKTSCIGYLYVIYSL